MMFGRVSVSEKGQGSQFVQLFRGEYDDYLCLYHTVITQVLANSFTKAIDNDRSHQETIFSCYAMCIKMHQGLLSAITI